MMLKDKKVILSLLGGFVLGKTGNMIFGSDTAKKLYVKAATAGMIAKDCTMEKVEALQACALDIADEARAEADKYQAKKDAECCPPDCCPPDCCPPDCCPPNGQSESQEDIETKTCVPSQS